MHRPDVRAETWGVRVLGYWDEDFDIVGCGPPLKLRSCLHAFCASGSLNLLPRSGEFIVGRKLVGADL